METPAVNFNEHACWGMSARLVFCWHSHPVSTIDTNDALTRQPNSQLPATPALLTHSALIFSQSPRAHTAGLNHFDIGKRVCAWTDQRSYVPVRRALVLQLRRALSLSSRIHRSSLCFLRSLGSLEIPCAQRSRLLSSPPFAIQFVFGIWDGHTLIATRSLLSSRVPAHVPQMCRALSY